MPTVGYENYLDVTRSIQKEKSFERTHSNEQWGSKYYIEDTITDHSRFRTIIKNFKARRGRNPEANAPLFIDKNTRVRYQGFYQHYEDHKTKPYSLIDNLIHKTDSSSEVIIEQFF